MASEEQETTILYVLNKSTGQYQRRTLTKRPASDLETFTVGNKITGTSITLQKRRRVGTSGTRMLIDVDNDDTWAAPCSALNLTQPVFDATPPDGVLAVPLMKHQRIVLTKRPASDLEGNMFTRTSIKRRRKAVGTIRDSSTPSNSFVHEARSSYHSNEAEARGSEQPSVSSNENPTLQAALDDITQPVLEATPPDGVLAVPLMKHQRIALAWMAQRENYSKICAGGILADDQGLGKTLSTISLIVSERPPRFKEEEEGVVDLVSDDEDEDDGNGRFLNSKSTKKARISSTADTPVSVPSLPTRRRLAGGTLVVCPTSVLRQWEDELRNKVTTEANLSVLVYHGSNRTTDPEELTSYDVVLTTYHIVSTELAKEVLAHDRDDDVVTEGGDDWWECRSDSRKRKIPAGADMEPGSSKATIQASARPLAVVSWFRVVLDEAQTIKNHRTLASKACSILRAKRRWCLSGTPIQNSINDLYSYFRFLRYVPYSSYVLFGSLIKFPVEHNPELGYRNVHRALNWVLLRRTKETLIDGQPIVNLPPKSLKLKALDFSVEERDFYTSLESHSQEQFKEYEEAGTLRQNYMNILLLLLRLRQACNHPVLTSIGCAPSSSTSTIRFSAENTAKRIGRDSLLELLKCLSASEAICSVCSDPPEDAVVSVCGHVFCNECALERLSGDHDEDKTCPQPRCKRTLSTATIFTRASLQSCVCDVQLAPDIVNRPDQKAGIFLADSSKVKAAMEMLLSLPKSELSGDKRPATAGQSQTTEKALVFSQWTKMLDLVEKKLRTSSIQYRRLDGTMSVADRDEAVKEFNSRPEITVMLMSLKAAGLGLNMVAANHVLLLDPWWNPTTEDQAIDRAHRIGQKRPVKVTRLTVKGTVEDRILKLQEKKRLLVASAFGEDGKGSRQSRLTIEDLRYLLKG